MAFVENGPVRPHVQAFADEGHQKFGARFTTYNGHSPDRVLALDCWDTNADMDALIDFARKNHDHFGIDYCIWKQRIWNPEIKDSWRAMANRGSVTANHFDHGHISFEGSGKATPSGDTSGTISQPQTCESREFRQGDTGDCVIGIQNHLNRFGHGVAVDGDFGPATHQAVVNFQNNRGLGADGIVGAKTWAAFHGTQIVPPPSPPPAALPDASNLPMIAMGDRGDTVKFLQERLRAHGHSVKIDGDFGPHTRARVQIHQAAWKLIPDGIVGQKTWPSLLVEVR